jgi:hypothetical protein
MGSSRSTHPRCAGRCRAREGTREKRVAPKRPELLHVRAAFNPEMAQLQDRFNRAHNSPW